MVDPSEKESVEEFEASIETVKNSLSKGMETSKLLGEMENLKELGEIREIPYYCGLAEKFAEKSEKKAKRLVSAIKGCVAPLEEEIGFFS